MRIKVLVRQAGLPHSPGDEREVSDAEAQALIAAGHAEAVEPPPARKVTKRRGGKAAETAAVEPPAERRG